MKVMFRRNPDGSVFTLFPEFASRADANWCLARTADWKPAEAELARAIAETEPAAPAEYQPLLAKVRSIGTGKSWNPTHRSWNGCAERPLCDTS